MKLVASLLLFLCVTMLLRSTALTALAARGVVVDVLAFATSVWALRYGETWGTAFGFALGLAADLDAGHWIGRHALALSLLGYAVGRLSHSLVRESPPTQLVLFFVATLLHQTWSAAFDFGGVAAWPAIVRRVLMAAIVTAPAATLLLFVVRHVSGQPVFGNASVRSGPRS